MRAFFNTFQIESRRLNTLFDFYINFRNNILNILYEACNPLLEK